MEFVNSFLDLKIAKKSVDKITVEYTFDLQDLPYGFSDLEPVIDATTMRVHHGKHHKKYADSMNEILDKNPGMKSKTLVELLQNPGKLSEEDKTKFLNNAGGHFNHTFFWRSMTPEMNQKPIDKLEEDINKQFGSFDKFKKEFIETGVKHFGSGWVWVWLCVDNGKLKIQGFANQSNPYIEKCGVPVLGCDVWEHAYYLKYQNNREKYLTNWFKVIDWSFVSNLYEENK
jgi:Fe-Mn family superoxide dismutase